MDFYRHLILYAILSCFAPLLQCASDPVGSFIFPPNSTNTNFNAQAPIVANITGVHFNDEFVIEYTLPDTVEAVWVSQNCYTAVNDTNLTSTLGNYGGSVYNGTDSSYTLSGVFNESTGTLLWNLGNGTGLANYTDLNYCYFVIWDWTLRSCSWGPFGLLSWNQGPALPPPLIISEMFRILPPNPEEHFLIQLEATTTQSTPPVTATLANVTCPPSGIPAVPIITPVPQMQIIPPLANHLTFPG